MEYILIRIRYVCTYENVEDYELHYVGHGNLDYILNSVRKMLYHIRMDTDDVFLGNFIHIESGNLEAKRSRYVRLIEFYRSSDYITRNEYEYLIIPIDNHCIRIY